MRLPGRTLPLHFREAAWVTQLTGRGGSKAGPGLCSQDRGQISKAEGYIRDHTVEMYVPDPLTRALQGAEAEIALPR